jgi:hypothetical protein
MRELMAEQVDLITSLPIKAAQRVHKLTIEAMSDGTRAAEVAQEIMRTGHVTESRAKLIARTETSRTVTAMTQTRAEYVGSQGYIWRTAMIRMCANCIGILRVNSFRGMTRQSPARKVSARMPARSITAGAGQSR